MDNDTLLNDPTTTEEPYRFLPNINPYNNKCVKTLSTKPQQKELGLKVK